MTNVKIGAEVTLVGKILESIDGRKDEHRHRVAFPTGLILWLPENLFTSIKNPTHPEPESGFALLDGRIAWRSGEHGAWETDSGVFRDWSHLLEMERPDSIVELVRKGEA